VNRSVLIADGNGARGSRIAEACESLGLVSRVVSHGAAALETALAEVPAVLVVECDLPLIDGEKLGEILHANPRTQSIRLLFLGDRSAEAIPAGEAPVLGPSAPPEDIAESVRALLDEHGEGEPEVEAEEDTTGAIEGQLAQLPLTDLLQLFHVSRKTGIVSLLRRNYRGEEESGLVLVSGGEVLQAEAGAVHGEKALFRLIGWDRGSFSFRPEPVVVEERIQTPTLSLLREGRRQIEEWERLARHMPPMDAHVTLKIQTASLPNVIHPLTQEVLLVLEHYSRIRDVVDHCAHPDYQVLRMLHTLIRRGMLSLRRDVPGPTGAPSQAGLFSPSQASRLHEWLQRDGSSGERSSDAKLVVAFSSSDACREFARVVGRLPGVTLNETTKAGEVPPDLVASLGRIAVDNETGIEFVQVPVGERYAPLWPTAAHGAVAVLLLLAGPLSVAMQSIGQIADAMRALPRSRVFHLLLLEKGQGIAPEALRENISLLDDTSMFLVPLENEGKAGILLREMFGRILP
jgi:CheY-like chemotaxis protein